MPNKSLQPTPGDALGLAGGVSIACECGFGVAELISLGHITSMSILPTQRDERIALLLYPFKAWVIAAWPFYLVFRASVSDVRYDIHVVGYSVMAGYIYSVPVLLLGALLQSLICRRGMAVRTVLYAVASIILVFSVWHF